MRGRLIQKFTLVLRKLDTRATADVADGGYDPQFRSLKPVPNGTQTGASTRREQDAINIPCQIKRQFWGLLELLQSGKAKDSNIVFILHMSDLESLGLRDGTTGNVNISSGTRIDKVLNEDGEVEWSFEGPQQLFVTACTPAGHGLNFAGVSKFNLCRLICRPRRMGQ